MLRYFVQKFCTENQWNLAFPDLSFIFGQCLAIRAFVVLKLPFKTSQKPNRCHSKTPALATRILRANEVSLAADPLAC